MSHPRHPERAARGIALLAAMFAAVLPSGAASAQDAGANPYTHAVATWVTLVATPGYERVATDRIMSAVSGFTRDVQGNLIKKIGEGSPRRVLACGIDESGYAVSQITDDGFLRVHMNGNGTRPQLWDQYHEGQRVIVYAVDRTNPSRARFVPGVVATRSNHLWRRRMNDSTPATIENLWIDVGARTRADVDRMGIDLLDPVVRDFPEWTFSDVVAGPSVGRRAGCEAIAAAAASSGKPATGETVYIISTQKNFSWAGLTGALARLGHVDSLFFIDHSVDDRSAEPHPVKAAPWPRLGGIDVGAMIGMGAQTKYVGFGESTTEKDLTTLHRQVAHAAGISPESMAPLPVAHGWVATPPVIVRDSLSRYADVISKLTEIYALSGFEQPMRDAIQSMLPTWAREKATVDSAGNLILAMGPDRDTTVFIAHMDEIGFLVRDIAADGMVTLNARGTFFPYMWEGQPALVHRADDKIPPRDGKLGCGALRDGPVRGMILPRDVSKDRNPQSVVAWFGMTGAELQALGVRLGSPVTGFKCSARFGDTRFAARSIDDRAGVTSLLLALSDVDPTKLDHKVIFVWSVREEGGLEGAKALAQTLGPSVHRVHAIDTFVSSDSPVESQRFAYAPIGQGAVVRALDNSSVTPPDEVDRVLKIARAAGIPAVAGVTNGGNDGSEFVRVGAINVSVSWPLRYSHSPAEVMDLRDLRSLTRLVAALAKAPTAAPKRP